MQDTFVPEPSDSRKTRKENRKQKRKKEMWAWIREFAVAVAVVLIIRTFFFSIINVQGNSMLNTLESGDRVYTSLLTARINGYERGDVVICSYPGRTDLCVKRLIGLPGDTVEIREGTVYVNGAALEEDYLDHVYSSSVNYSAITLEEGEYFVLGDNRPISHDSHSADVGPVTQLKGKVRFILWPLSRFGSVE